MNFSLSSLIAPLTLFCMLFIADLIQFNVFVQRDECLRAATLRWPIRIRPKCEGFKDSFIKILFL